MSAQYTPVLTATTREHLRQRPRTLSYQIIFQDTGLTVAWLTDFASNTTREFSCDKVEKLYAYLTGKQIKV